MQKCSIGHSDFIIKDSFDEITIAVARNLYHICKTEMPFELKKKIELIGNSKDQEELTKVLTEWEEKHIDSDFTEFYKLCIIALSDIEEVELVHPDSIKEFYQSYVEQIVIGLMISGVTHVAEIIESFKYKGSTYNVPNSKKLFDLTIAMEGISMVQFAEYSDMLALIEKDADGYRFMSTAIAILCLKKGEVYSDDLILSREHLFDDLTMDVVFNVFFCIVSFTATLRVGLECCLEVEGIRKQLMFQALTAWDGVEISSTLQKNQEGFKGLMLSSN